MAIGGNLTALKRWQKRANTDYKKTVLGFWFWLLGIFLFVVNWLLLMVFTLGFIKNASCNLSVFFGVLLFDAMTNGMQFLVCRVMEQAELARVGSKKVGFDRFHLVSLTRFTFHMYAAVFRLTLLVRLTDWSGFVIFYAATTVTHTLTQILPMNGKAHRVAQEGRLQAVMRHTTKKDLLHQRGMCCFSSYLQNTATHIAALQYCVFVFFLDLMPNRSLFPHYSTDSSVVSQQIGFAICAWCLNYFSYTVICVLFDRRYNLSPTCTHATFASPYLTQIHCLQ